MAVLAANCKVQNKNEENSKKNIKCCNLLVTRIISCSLLNDLDHHTSTGVERY
uniref:Uncharacterized protein n=1 Tax=Anguilla anguilla TaxID=7936 RepID=A0A0E9QN88_ANGAN